METLSRDLRHSLRMLAKSPGFTALAIVNGLRLALAGIVIGMAVSVALTRLMVTLLFQTSATDPVTFVSSATVFALVAMLASYFPARRAMRINPTEALRTG